MLIGCKWANDVIDGSPYFIEPDYLEQNKLDYILHGDDIIYNSEGESFYTKFENIGKFK